MFLFRLDLTTEKVNSLEMNDDSISSMTYYVHSTSKNFLFCWEHSASGIQGHRIHNKAYMGHRKGYML